MKICISNKLNPDVCYLNIFLLQFKYVALSSSVLYYDAKKTFLLFGSTRLRVRLG